MNFDSMTSKAIAQELGRRIEQLRLEQNVTQQQLADEIGLSRVSYRKLIMGGGKFENIISVLRVLGKLDLVQQFIPESTFSPIEQLKLKRKQRKRAAPRQTTAGNDKSDLELDW